MRSNHLAGARSPYLAQHAGNPVDWFPWGADAFRRARALDRPVLLSVGYAACHWCHVMAHESFEDEATARLLDETFVCVKVDREERPDVDALYMEAVHVLSGRGGWPMTVLLTPEGAPFWAGTYLPRAHLQQLAEQVGVLWQTDAERLRAKAGQVAERVRDLTAGLAYAEPFTGSDTDLLGVLDAALSEAFDERRGGYGGRPRFPPHAELLYLLDRAERPGGAARADEARTTLLAMADGGIHDHLAGGFHRYSTDADWLLPHFEKMLYDNALLTQAYARAAGVLGEARFAEVAQGILAWVRREMSVPGGGFASSLDADTEGEEGRTYTWSLAEVEAALPAADVALAVRAYGVLPDGNFREEATGRRTGQNVLYRPERLPDLARALGCPPAEVADRLAGVRARLLAARARRPRPGRDDKVLTAWNGLLLSAFATVGARLGDAEALDDGRRLARALLDGSRRGDGTVLRFPRGSGPEIPGFADDHVHLAEGLLDLSDATGDPTWAATARDVAERLRRGFEDPDAGGFFTTSALDHETLFARRKESFDGPIPSENGTAARVFLRLFARTGETAYRHAADRALALWRPLMANPRAARGMAALHRALATRVALDEATGAAPASGDATARAEGVQVDAFLERAETRPGGTVRLALRVLLDPGWHAADRPGGGGPVAVALAEGAPVGLADVRVEGAGDGAPRSPDRAEGALWVRARLDVPLDASRGPRRVPLVVRVQPCSETACLEDAALSLSVPLRFGAEDGPARHPRAFRSSAPEGDAPVAEESSPGPGA